MNPRVKRWREMFYPEVTGGSTQLNVKKSPPDGGVQLVWSETTGF